MTLAHAYPAFTAMPPTSRPDLADLAEKLRGFVKRSQKTQRQIAEQSGIPSPSYLSHMVNGRINWVESEYFRPLSRVLDLTVEEIQELNPDIVVNHQTLRHTAIADTRPPVELSETLRAFIDKYAQTFKELLEPRWQRWLANTDFRDEPETPEDWLAVFMYFKEKVNPR